MRGDSNNDHMLNKIFLGEVASVQNYGAFIRIPGGSSQGLVHRTQISNANVPDASEVLSKEDRVWCKVISINPDGKIALSMKVVDQGSGKDLDPNGVQIKLDEQRRKEWVPGGQRKAIALDAVYNTTCSKCGTRGHLGKDCFQVAGGKTYELLNEEEGTANVGPSAQTVEGKDADKKRRKKEKKEAKKQKKAQKKLKKALKKQLKKEKKMQAKKKKRKKSSSSDSSDSSSDSSSQSDEERKDKKNSSSSNSPSPVKERIQHVAQSKSVSSDRPVGRVRCHSPPIMHRRSPQHGGERNKSFSPGRSPSPSSTKRSTQSRPPKSRGRARSRSPKFPRNRTRTRSRSHSPKRSSSNVNRGKYKR